MTLQFTAWLQSWYLCFIDQKVLGKHASSLLIRTDCSKSWQSRHGSISVVVLFLFPRHTSVCRRLTLIKGQILHETHGEDGKNGSALFRAGQNKGGIANRHTWNFWKCQCDQCSDWRGHSSGTVSHLASHDSPNNECRGIKSRETQRKKGKFVGRHARG